MASAVTSFNDTSGIQSQNNTIPTQSSNSNSIFALQNPLGNGTDSFCKLIKTLLDVIILFGIPIATFFVVYAGFRLVIARGNPEALKKARLNLFYTVVGIAIFLGAWLLGQIIAGTIKDLNVTTPGLNSC